MEKLFKHIKKHTALYVVIALLLVGGIGYLTYDASQSNLELTGSLSTAQRQSAQDTIRRLEQQKRELQSDVLYLQDEIQSLIASLPTLVSSENYVGAWDFNEISRNIAQNIYPGTLNATIHGAKSTSGNWGKELLFTGKDYVSLPVTDSLNPTKELTVMLRANWDKPTAGEVLIANSGYQIAIDNNGNIGAFVNTDGEVLNAGVPTSKLSSGWHHFGLTFDGTVLMFFVDGEEVAKSNATSNQSIKYVSKSIATLIGATPGSDSTPQSGSYFNGSIDDVAISNAALLPDVIRNHFVHGTSQSIIISTEMQIADLEEDLAILQSRIKGMEVQLYHYKLLVK